MFRVDPVSSRKQIATHAIWFGVWLAVTLIGLLLTPSKRGHGTHQQLGFPPCSSALLLGRPCPGCGLTTSWTATLHGNFKQAFSAHPLGSAMYGLFTISALGAGYGFAAKKKMGLGKLGYQVMWALILIYIAFGIWRFAFPPPGYGNEMGIPPIAPRRGD